MRRLLHLLASLILPVSAAVLMPLWLLHRFGGGWTNADDLGSLALRIAGVIVFAAGFRAVRVVCVALWKRRTRHARPVGSAPPIRCGGPL